MRILNTLQELWDYSAFCPICQESVRKIHVSVGPDRYLSNPVFIKNENNLIINCKFRANSDQLKIDIQYNINCLDGTFEVVVGENTNIARVTGSNFYFYLGAECNKCNSSYINTSDIQLERAIFSEEKIEFSIERECLYLLKTKDKYKITLWHPDKMQISKCIVDKNNFIIESGEVFEYPIINIDLINYDKTINKIKTLILFS